MSARLSLQAEFDDEPIYIVDSETDAELVVIQRAGNPAKELDLARRIKAMMEADS